MRLLNTSTRELENFIGADTPSYAILSHTWEPEGEFLFEDLTRIPNTEHRSRPGYSKVENACLRALKDGCKYIWIDTCCIDKTSSAELSEAINSMFRWYERSSICYAFLSDVADGKVSFGKSRWFSRGWTLQELIAPDHVVFLDAHWQDIGDRQQLTDKITLTTGIEQHMLVMRHPRASDLLRGFSVAQRMKWASKRETSRVEDMAYCLMGLFDVNMPLLYGEGDKAFRRLQEAIINESADHSVLAFRAPGASIVEWSAFSPVLAPHVRFFCEDIRCEWMQSSEPPRYANGNVVLVAYVTALNVAQDGVVERYAPSHVAYLDCFFDDDYLSRPAIFLARLGPDRYKRCGAWPLLLSLAASGSGQHTRVVGSATPFKSMLPGTIVELFLGL
jgi:hypothetical protein